jgi:hypothetical protein
MLRKLNENHAITDYLCIIINRKTSKFASTFALLFGVVSPNVYRFIQKSTKKHFFREEDAPEAAELSKFSKHQQKCNNGICATGKN